MKFGLSVPVQHPSNEPGAERIGELFEQVKLARDMGFDSISASQHYLAAPFQYFQPIPYLEAKYRAYSQWGQDRESPRRDLLSAL